MATPKNISFAHPSKFRLVFPFMPFMDEFYSTEKEAGRTFTLYCSQVSLPAFSMPSIGVDTPYYQMKIPYEGMSFGELTAVYSVDEYFNNFQFLYNWMLRMKNPEEYNLGGKNEMITASLFIYSNNDNPKFRFTLVNVFPVGLGAINFSKEQADGEDLKHSVTFTLDYYKLETD